MRTDRRGKVILPVILVLVVVVGAGLYRAGVYRRAKVYREVGGETPVPKPPARVNPKDGLTYVQIRPGTFRMGCSASDNECYDDEKSSKVARQSET